MERRQHKIKMRIEKVTRRPGRHKKRRTKKASTEAEDGWSSGISAGKQMNSSEMENIGTSN